MIYSSFNNDYCRLIDCSLYETYQLYWYSKMRNKLWLPLEAILISRKIIKLDQFCRKSSNYTWTKNFNDLSDVKKNELAEAGPAIWSVYFRWSIHMTMCSHSHAIDHKHFRGGGGTWHCMRNIFFVSHSTWSIVTTQYFYYVIILLNNFRIVLQSHQSSQFATTQLQEMKHCLRHAEKPPGDMRKQACTFEITSIADAQKLATGMDQSQWF